MVTSRKAPIGAPVSVTARKVATAPGVTLPMSRRKVAVTASVASAVAGTWKTPLVETVTWLA